MIIPGGKKFVDKLFIVSLWYFYENKNGLIPPFFLSCLSFSRIRFANGSFLALRESRRTLVSDFPTGCQGIIDRRSAASHWLCITTREKRDGKVGEERDFQLQGLSVLEFHSERHCSRVARRGQDFDPSTIARVRSLPPRHLTVLHVSESGSSTYIRWNLTKRAILFFAGFNRRLRLRDYRNEILAFLDLQKRENVHSRRSICVEFIFINFTMKKNIVNRETISNAYYGETAPLVLPRY